MDVPPASPLPPPLVSAYFENFQPWNAWRPLSDTDCSIYSGGQTATPASLELPAHLMEPSSLLFSEDTCTVIVITIPLALTTANTEGALWMCQALP